jgi:Helix-turn-helix domain
MRHYPFKRASKPRGPVQQAVGRMLNVQQAAELLGTSERWVRRRTSRGLLPYRKLCGRIFFLRAELEAFVNDLPGITLSEAKENLSIRNGDGGQR